MKEEKNCACSKGESAKTAEPNNLRDLNTETMVTPGDLGKMPKESDGEGVSEESVEESVVMINPDVDSMESRG